MDFLSLVFRLCFIFFQVTHLKRNQHQNLSRTAAFNPANVTANHARANSAAQLFLQGETIKGIRLLFNANSSPTLSSYVTIGIYGPTVKFMFSRKLKEGQTWNFSFGIFLRAPFARTRASSTLWLARRSWICFSKGSGTKIYTPLLVATITFPGQSRQTYSV